MQPIIYHNPKCATSRATLKLLRDRGYDPTIIEYLKTPPSAEELAKLLTQLGRTARDLMRRKEPEYRSLALDDERLSATALLRTIARHPRLMERPIVVAGRKAALGRPPEAVLKILE